MEFLGKATSFADADGKVRQQSARASGSTAHSCRFSARSARRALGTSSGPEPSAHVRSKRPRPRSARQLTPALWREGGSWVTPFLQLQKSKIDIRHPRPLATFASVPVQLPESDAASSAAAR
jgi:hypothetical protein